MGGCFSKARHDEINVDEERTESQEIEETPINVLIKEGNALLDLRKFHEAEQKFEEALALDNMSIDAWRGKGWASAGLDQVKEAEKYHERADNLPTFIHAKKLYEAGQGTSFYYEWGHEHMAVVGAWAYEMFADDIIYLEMYEEAIKCSDYSISLDPRRSSGSHKCKGQAFHGLHRYSEAIECFDKAIVISDNQYASANYHCLKAKSLLALGRETEAIECFHKAGELAHDPEYVKSYIEHEKLGKNKIHLLQKLAEFGSIKIEKLEIYFPDDTVAASSTDAEYQATQIKTDEIKHRQSIIIDQTLAAIALRDDKVTKELLSEILRILQEGTQEKLQHNEETRRQNEEIKRQNEEMKKEIALLKSSKADRVEISYAITMNFIWEATDSRIKAIKNDAQSFKYWDGFRFTFNGAYDASKLALEGTVNIDSSSMITSGIATAASLIPFAGDIVSSAVSTIGEIVQSALIKQKAARFTKIASDAKDCAEFVMHLAIKITLHPHKAREIHSDDAPAQAISAWGKFVAKFESFGSKVAKAIEGDRYDTPEAKMGHRDALLLIEQLGDGKILLDPRETLIDRCCEVLGLAELESGFGFADGEFDS